MSRFSFALASASAFVKASGCDYMVQRFVEGREKIDRKRLAVFACFGTSFTGTGK